LSPALAGSARPRGKPAECLQRTGGRPVQVFAQMVDSADAGSQTCRIGARGRVAVTVYSMRKQATHQLPFKPLDP
jgi:hypothetical protein